MISPFPGGDVTFGKRLDMVKSSSRSLRFLLGLCIAAVVLALPPASPAHAASFTVTSTGDQPDGDTTDGLCRIAGSNQCTLRAAIQQANASPGNDTITFKLGTATITPSSALPDLTDDKGVTIRGDGRITLDGSRAHGNGISIVASRDNKIQGLILRNWGNAITIVGALFNHSASYNIVGTDADGVNDAQERNVIRDNTFGVMIRGTGAHHNAVAGNYIGTNPAGTNAAGNSAGIWIGDYAGETWVGTNGDGINDAAEGNVISGNQVGIVAGDTRTLTIAGNIIGLAANGNDPLGNIYGMVLRTTTDSRIGTNGDGISDDAERNVISSSADRAMELDAVTDTVIAGNYIGTPADGSGNRGNGIGIVIMESNLNGTSTGNMIGGDTLEEGNIIAHSAQSGIVIHGDLKSITSPVGNSIFSNRIFDSGAMGIDLKPNQSTVDVDPNDPGDSDAGPNNMLNHPELSIAESGGGVTAILGRITSGLPDTTFEIQFFSNPNCHPSGHGEGQQFLGSMMVTTNAAGNASFEAILPVGVNLNHVVTATATDPAGNTSEFSACASVVNP
jgi:CSLREA domain-containing protein